MNPKKTKYRIYTMSFASVYPHYAAKEEYKERTEEGWTYMLGKLKEIL